MVRGLDGFLFDTRVALCGFEGPLEGVVSYEFPVVMARGKHLFPFRTEQLSPSAPMVLGPQGPGRVGRRRFNVRTSRPSGGSFAFNAGAAGRRNGGGKDRERACCGCGYGGAGAAVRGMRLCSCGPRRRNSCPAAGARAAAATPARAGRRPQWARQPASGGAAPAVGAVARERRQRRRRGGWKMVWHEPGCRHGPRANAMTRSRRRPSRPTVPPERATGRPHGRPVAFHRLCGPPRPVSARRGARRHAAGAVRAPCSSGSARAPCPLAPGAPRRAGGCGGGATRERRRDRAGLRSRRPTRGAAAARARSCSSRAWRRPRPDRRCAGWRLAMGWRRSGHCVWGRTCVREARWRGGRKPGCATDLAGGLREGPSGRSAQAREPRELHTSSFVRTRATTSSVKPLVVASPPRSGVRTPAAVASSTAS
jgi:hypothetical protein